MTFYNSDEVYAYLNRFLNFERKFEPTEYRLDRMHRLMGLFGHPDRAYRIVHVAGSKGKGSTATMLASIMAEAGRNIGLYTSPHLLSFTERIAINGKPVGPEILLPAAEELSDAIDGEKPEDFPGGEAPTYFELLTMLGFLCFRRAACNDVVIEVGLGGRLDSTNVITPLVSVITPIELEHTDILGDTIEKIAGEKAGIIKPGVPVFTSAQRPEALEVFRARAAESGSPLVILDEAVDIEDCLIDAGGTSATLRWKGAGAGPALVLRSPMIGQVQARNAALAACVARRLGYSDDAIVKGIAGARLRARFEILAGRPTVILDGAHTADSILACTDDFSCIFKSGGELLFGCAKGKPPRAMAAALRKAFSEAIVTKPGTFKESDPAEIEAAFLAEGFSVQRMDDTDEAIKAAIARAGAKNVPLLITGSFYLCAAAAAILAERTGS